MSTFRQRVLPGFRSMNCRRHFRSFVVVLSAAIGLAGCAHISTDSALVGDSSLKDDTVEQRVLSALPLPPAPTREVIRARHVPLVAQPIAEVNERYLLDSGDKLRVFVFDQPDLSRIYAVDHAGNIMVPLIGLVHARKRTTYGVAHSIRQRLAARFVRDPHVTVDIFEHRPFFILGEVRAAGQYPYVNGMTIETAVAIAGGYSERANQRGFEVTRRAGGLVDVIEAPADFILRPGDTVKVLERFF